MTQREVSTGMTWARGSCPTWPDRQPPALSGDLDPYANCSTTHLPSGLRPPAWTTGPQSRWGPGHMRPPLLFCLFVTDVPCGRWQGTAAERSLVKPGDPMPSSPLVPGSDPEARTPELPYFLRRNVVPKAAMGLSNPLFHEGNSMPATGRAPAYTMGPPEPVPTMHAIHPSQPPRSTAAAVTPKRPPPAVSTSRFPRPRGRHRDHAA